MSRNHFRRIFLTFAALTLCCAARTITRAQERPTPYLYPVKGVSGLCAANFGEIRPAHFHSGVDIKTENQEGKPLVAVADGHISRVVIQTYGYGRGLYLSLDDGKTAVYGHLLRFTPAMESHLDSLRRARHIHTLDRSFEAAQWPVRRGDTIGFSGNSGSSFGPHLHFELRDTQSGHLHNLVKERIIRPKDTMQPRIMRLHYVEIDSLDGICLRAPFRSYNVLRHADGHYRLNREQPIEVGRRGYFIAEVSDRRDDVHNTFGIWRLTGYLDRQPYFEYRMDGFNYSHNRFSDAISCYPLQITSRNEVIRMAHMGQTPCEVFYPVMTDRGVIRTKAGDRHTVRLEVEDDSGNVSTLSFEILGRKGEFRATAPEGGIPLPTDEEHDLILDRDFSVSIPSNALFEAKFARHDTMTLSKSVRGVKILSRAHRLFPQVTPLNTSARVTLSADIPPHLALHTTLARYNSRRGLSNIGGHPLMGKVSASTRTMDWFVVVADTLPPHVTPRFEKGADLSRNEDLRFTVGDNFSGVAAYTLLIDGEWQPVDRRPMRGLLYHKFTTPPTRRRHSVELYLRDGVGNRTVWRGSFFR